MRDCVVCSSSSSEKKHLTVLMSATADGQMLPPMIFLSGKTDQIIRNLIFPSGVIVKTNVLNSMFSSDTFAGHLCRLMPSCKSVN